MCRLGQGLQGIVQVQGLGTVLLGEFLPVVATDQGGVQVLRRGRDQGVLQQDLARGVVGQTFPRTMWVMPWAASSTTTASW